MSKELLTSAAADRNKQPILNVLESVLPETGTVLEVASGTGQHICFFAAALPALTWQPTEPDAPARASMMARIREAGLENVQRPVALDVHEANWPVATGLDAMLCINMIHISPWSATGALMRGAALHLRTDGKLVLYGPYRENDTAVQSNLDFDASLKRRNPEWGLRALEDVTLLAAEHGLRRSHIVRMPANNLTVVFSKMR